MNQQQQPSINLNNTEAITTPNDKNIFEQGFILRKVSKFITGGDEDSIVPIPVFYDSETGKIVGSTLPPELRDEYKDEII